MKKMEFAYAAPESMGIESAALTKALKAARDGAHRGIEIHDMIIMRKGTIVCEAYFQPYHKDAKHAIYSQTKSFMSTAMGLAIGDGLVKLDDYALDYFPEVDRASIAANADRMKVRHLMSMACGHETDPMGAFREKGPEGFFAWPVTKEPGEHFFYNTAASNICGMIVERVTGKSMYAYLKERIFDKIGMEIEEEDWMKVHGACSGGFGLHVRAMDVLRLANLYLLRGKWEGEQLIPEEWVELVSRKKIDCANEFTSWAAGYTYQFWNCDFADGYRIDGAGAQQADIVPEKDMVILFNSALHGEVSDYAQVLARYYIYPAVHDEALPENAEAQAELCAMVKAVAQPEKTAYEMLCGAAGSYKSDKEGMERIELTEKDGEMTLLLGDYRLVFGLDGAWRVKELQPAADDAVARTKYAAGRGKWSGKRFRGRVTLFPDIRSTYVDMEVTESGLVLLIRTDWLPAVNDGKPFKAVRV